MTEGLTYNEAGVDIDAADESVQRIKAHVATTMRPEVLSEVGGFGGLFHAGFAGYEDPVLVSSTDGVGTKSKVAQLTGRYDTIGVDLVAMSVDDIAVQGAEPLFFLDYVSVGSVDPARIEAIVAGVARGCRDAGCALLGGEISEHPGLLGPEEFDLVGFAVGVVDREAILPNRVAAGDVVVGMHSPGLRCNGYSLARRALLDRAGRELGEPAWVGADRSLGEELMEPSVVYAPAMTAMRNELDVHAFAHVTGGGIPDNLDRVLPGGLGARVQRGTWPEPQIFAEVQQAGGVANDEMARVFNLGIGMLVVVAPTDADRVVAVARASGHDAWTIGKIVDDRDGVLVE